MKKKIAIIAGFLVCTALFAANLFYQDVLMSDRGGHYVGLHISSLSGSNIWNWSSSLDGNAFDSIVTDGSNNLSFQGLQLPNELTNLSFSGAVSSNTILVTLTQGDGASAPTGVRPSYATFRSTTATSGAIMRAQFTATATLTIPAAASLGLSSGSPQTLYVYLASDSTSELCVSGTSLPESVLTSATAISSGSTSLTTLYCTSSHTTRPIRLIGTITATWSNPNWGTLAVVATGTAASSSSVGANDLVMSNGSSLVAAPGIVSGGNGILNFATLNLTSGPTLNAYATNTLGIQNSGTNRPAEVSGGAPSSGKLRIEGSGVTNSTTLTSDDGATTSAHGSLSQTVAFNITYGSTPVCVCSVDQAGVGAGAVCGPSNVTTTSVVFHISGTVGNVDNAYYFSCGGKRPAGS